MSTGTAAPAKPSPTVAKSVDKLPGDSAAAIAKEDPVKAIEKLEARARAVNVNNIARVSNSHLTSDDEKLTPLVSVKTGKAIDKFPSISREISKMTRTIAAAPVTKCEITDS